MPWGSGGVPGPPQGGPGTPPGGWSGYPPGVWVAPPGGVWVPPGGRVRVPPPGGVWVPPWGGTQSGTPRPGQKEYSLHGGRYASRVHAGGLSCLIWISSPLPPPVNYMLTNFSHIHQNRTLCIAITRSPTLQKLKFQKFIEVIQCKT